MNDSDKSIGPRSNSGWREDGDPNGLVIHMVVGAGLLCRTRLGAHTSGTTRRSEVNCERCKAKIARIFGVTK